ncbi:MAG: HAD-IA family hydrolase [Anaerolineaceae bacterium]|nr:HAD-IA family hydrolase [Anaerolineaceae bacterium]
MSENIEAIFFDMNGTLRVRELHEPTQRAAFERILRILGKGEASQGFWDGLSQRYQAYGEWAQGNLTQLSESEIWSRWMLPDGVSREAVAQADELMLAWMERKGRAVPKPGAREIIEELKKRGYRLGVISNTMSTLDLPRFITANKWNDLFEVVALSANIKSRKPAPDMFIHAAQAIQVHPNRCAYVGNRIAKDIVGCKRAGFALGVMLETAGMPRIDQLDQSVQPELTIASLDDLLNIFPADKKVK